jgi:hypothetical protein
LAWRCVDESFLSKIRSNSSGAKKGAWTKEFALSARQQQEPRRIFAAHFDETNAATPADNTARAGLLPQAIVWPDSTAFLIATCVRTNLVFVPELYKSWRGPKTAHCITIEAGDAKRQMRQSPPPAPFMGLPFVL